MNRTRRVSAIAAVTMVAVSAAGLMPGTAIADEFDINAQWCQDTAAGPDLRIGGCTWLLQSGRLAQENAPIALDNRGSAWDDKGECDRAIEDCAAALRLMPDYASVLNNRGSAWDDKGEYDRAIEDYTAALRLKPDLHQALYNRGNAWKAKGEYDRAIEDYTAALRLKPDLHQALHNRGNAWKAKGEYDRAIEDYTAALRLNPDYVYSLNSLAWLMATALDGRVRDGSRAVRLAEKAISLQDDAVYRDTVAAAYAEAGRFTDAVTTQERAVSMARAEGSSGDRIARFEDRLGLYRAGRPYREKR